MKSFKDYKAELKEASIKKPQDNTAAKVNAAVSALQLRKQGINPSTIISAQKRLNTFASKNMSPSQSYQRLGTNVRNQYFQFGNVVPTGLLDPSINTGTFRQVVQRLKSTNQQITKAQIDAEKMAAKAQQKASKQQVQESSEEFNPPALITLKRIGVRNFPDGRRVAMYLNKQLDLVFSVPFVGKGQTSGEIIPGVSSVQGGIREDVDSEDKGEYDYEGDMAISQLKSIISNSIKLKDMLEPDTNLPEWVQAKITLAEDYVVTAANYMEGQQDNQGAGDELDESAASFIAHMKAAMQAKDEEIKARHLLKAKDARLSMTNAEIAKYKDLLNQHREMVSEEVEELDEANVRIVGKKKLIRARVRGGKIQRRKVVSAVPGYKVVGGQVKRESAKERLDRKRGARKAKIKRRAKLARSLIKRKRSLRKRASLGLK